MTNEDDISPLRNLFRRKRYPMDERLPDGRSVDELLRAAQQSGDVNAPRVSFGSAALSAPQNQQAITRPRTFRDVLQQRLQQPTPQNPVPEAATQSDALPQAQPNVPFPDANAVRPRRAEPRDYIADDEAYLRSLEKNEGSFWKRLAAAGIRGAQAATHQDISPILTSREQEIADVTNRLGRGLTVAQKRAQIEQGEMVPVTLEDGSVVMAPRRSAGTLQSNQQRIHQQAKTSEDRVRHWNSMEKRDRTRSIISLYNSGALNDPALLEYAADELGLPGTMREKFIAGRMRGAIADDGTLLNVNAQTGTAAPVLNQQGQPQKSIQGTLEQGRNRRAAEAQAGQNQRAAMRGTSGTRGTSVDKAALRRAAKLVADIDDARGQMEDADKKGDAGAKARAQRKGEIAASELNALGAGYEAGRGEGGYPYYKQKGEQAMPTEDPKLRKYANQFFNGDIKAAQAAIEQQRKQ